MTKGIIYIMTTAVSGLIKIGIAETKQYKERIRHLEHNGYYNVKAYISWLKSIRPQKKQEWNENDEIYIQYAIDGLTSYIHEHPDPMFGNSTPCEKAAVKWL